MKRHNVVFRKKYDKSLLIGFSQRWNLFNCSPAHLLLMRVIKRTGKVIKINHAHSTYMDKNTGREGLLGISLKLVKLVCIRFAHRRNCCIIYQEHRVRTKSTYRLPNELWIYGLACFCCGKQGGPCLRCIA